MENIQKTQEQNDRKQVVKFSLVRLFMKKKTHKQTVPEDHFCRTLNLTK